MRHKSAPKDIEGGAVAGRAGSVFFGGVGVLKLLVQHSSSSGETWVELFLWAVGAWDEKIFVLEFSEESFHNSPCECFCTHFGINKDLHCS